MNIHCYFISMEKGFINMKQNDRRIEWALTHFRFPLEMVINGMTFQAIFLRLLFSYFLSKKIIIIVIIIPNNKHDNRMFLPECFNSFYVGFHVSEDIVFVYVKVCVFESGIFFKMKNRKKTNSSFCRFILFFSLFLIHTSQR